MAGKRNFGPWGVAIVLAAGAVICLVVALYPRAEPQRPPEPAKKVEPLVPTPKTLQGPAVQQPAQPPQPKMMRYPDGSQLPPLNGVTDPPSIDWPSDVPFAPVVGKEKDGQGIEWYRHKDGSRTTVQMIWRSDLKRMDAMARIENPGRSVPIEHDPDATPRKKG